MPFAHFVALAFALTDPAVTYDARADRRRFPPDSVLLSWMAFSDARIEHLQSDLFFVQNRVTRDRINREIMRTVRIRQAIYWMAYPSSEGASEEVMRWWMSVARGYLTAEEYHSGNIPWGGVPRMK
jgi:hypothetical protein